MKKTLLYAFAFAAISTFASCKCQTCKHNVLADDKICKDDFNSNDDFNDAVTAAENFGYKCSPSN